MPRRSEGVPGEPVLTPPRSISMQSELVTPPRASESIQSSHQSSIQMTPYKQTTSSRPEQGFRLVRQEVDAFLKVEFDRALYGPVSVENFVKNVWGFDPDSITESETSVLKRLGDLLRAYTLSGDNGKLSETDRYEPLVNVFTRLLEQPAGLSPIDAKWQIIGTKSTTSNYLNLKPDLVWTTHEPKDLQLPWPITMVAVEVKADAKSFRKSDIPNPNRGRKRIQEDEDDAEYDPHRSKKQRTFKSVSAGALSTSASHSGSESLNVSTSTSTSGRSWSNVKGLTDHQYQLGSYLHESMANGIRSWASGALIDGYHVQLWYADRMGLIHSPIFNFQLYPRQLLIVLCAIRSRGLDGFGYHPSVVYGSSKSNEKSSPVDLEGANLTLTNPIDAEGNRLDPSPLVLKIKESTPRFIQYGLVARGTTVLAVESPKIWGTRRTLIAKVGWPVKSRTAEDQFIRDIYEKLGKSQSSRWLDHIVTMRCSQTLEGKDTKLPRNLFGPLPGFEIEERVCRTLVFEEYLPLEQVNSVDEFKSVFLSIVRAHHHVYKYAKIIHRDLSDRNIMFLREASGVKGKLCDWDLAKYVEDAEDDPAILHQRATEYLAKSETSHSANLDFIPETPEGAQNTQSPQAAACNTPTEGETSVEPNPKPRHRTGTGPFIAIELLSRAEFTASVHVYRYDLESLFYILVWFCALFDPRSHRYRRSPQLETWRTGEFEHMGSAKARFLSQGKMLAEITSLFSPEFSELKSKWVRPWWLLFREAQQMDNDASVIWTDEDVSSETKIQTVQDLLSRRDAYITYERAMEVIKEEVL